VIAVDGLRVVELYDFDPETGRISNPLTLLSPTLNASFATGEVYGASFSPDGSRLYAGCGDLLQWSLDAGTPADVVASLVVVSDTTMLPDFRFVSGMQIGPDGRIYFHQAPGYLGVIDRPNERGAACGVRDTAIATGRIGTGYGLPNNIDTRSFFTRPEPGQSSVALSSQVSGEPGDTIDLVLEGDSIIAGMLPTRFALTLVYDTSMMRPLAIDDPQPAGRHLGGTLLHDWSLRVEHLPPDTLRLSLVAPEGSLPVVGSGLLIRIPFATFLSMIPEQLDAGRLRRQSEVRYTIDPEPPVCLQWAMTPATVQLEFCGDASRLMELLPPPPRIISAVWDVGRTRLTFALSLPVDQSVRLTLFDAVGKQVALLHDGPLPAGGHGVDWNAADAPDGIYFYTFDYDGGRSVGSVILRR
jgi:hypothetical protein